MGSLLLGLGIVFGGMMFGARKYLEKNLTQIQIIFQKKNY